MPAVENPPVYHNFNRPSPAGWIPARGGSSLAINTDQRHTRSACRTPYCSDGRPVKPFHIQSGMQRFGFLSRRSFTKAWRRRGKTVNSGVRGCCSLIILIHTIAYGFSSRTVEGFELRHWVQMQRPETIHIRRENAAVRERQVAGLGRQLCAAIQAGVPTARPRDARSQCSRAPGAHMRIRSRASNQSTSPPATSRGKLSISPLIWRRSARIKSASTHPARVPILKSIRPRAYSAPNCSGNHQR